MKVLLLSTLKKSFEHKIAYNEKCEIKPQVIFKTHLKSLLSYRMLIVDLISRQYKRLFKLFKQLNELFQVSFSEMTPLELDECFDFVHKLVLSCGDVLREGFKNTGKVTTKNAAHELVTFWDGEIEKILINGIKEKYPEHK